MTRTTSTDSRPIAFPVAAAEAAHILTAIGLRPEIMGMPTFVALTNGAWEIVWLPERGWIPGNRR